MMDQDLIEAVARAICKVEWPMADPDEFFNDDPNRLMWEQWKDAASAALTVMRSREGATEKDSLEDD